MRDRAILLCWLSAVVVITFVHEPRALGGLLLIALVAQGGSAPKIALRALVAVALVNLTVSIAFIVSAWLSGSDWMTFVLRLNLRVFLLALLTFWMIRHVDLARAAAPWPSLQFLIVLALGQIRTFTSLLADYRMAFSSRSPTRPPLRTRFGSAGRQASAMLDKAERQSEELNQGMRARGFFDREFPQ
ncbi:MAG TPA: hypothetical protein VJ908_12585 [Wenzhouxiangellaceae bacterium]|nr:hypothetical protein [Wenzhouxiangellaceae bacterium]